MLGATGAGGSANPHQESLDMVQRLGGMLYSLSTEKFQVRRYFMMV